MEKRTWGEPNEMPAGLTSEVAHRFAREFAVALIQGDEATAQRLVREAFHPATSGTAATLEEKLATPLVSTGLTMRVVNKLERINVATIGELLQLRAEQLLAVPQFGLGSLRHCYAMLRRYGFKPERKRHDSLHIGPGRTEGDARRGDGRVPPASA